MNEIKTIGIIGSGKMGSDLFNYLSDFKFNLKWYTRNEDHQGTIKKTFHKKIKRQLKHGIISQEVFELKSKYQITTNLNQLSDCDLVIESIIEELDVKVELFNKLENIVKPSCILASNSSSILPSEISADLKTKSRILGIHFFYPIAFKNIVEVVQSKYTDEISVEKVKIFLSEIKRFFLLQEEKEAFILNRFLLQLQIRAFELLNKSELSYNQFDQISQKLIPEFGLFEVMDHVGHNTMYNAILNYSRMEEDKTKYKAILDELLHRKSNREGHFFIQPDAEKRSVDKQIESKIIEELNQTANNYINFFSEEYNLNIYNLNKAIEEFCGIKF